MDAVDRDLPTLLLATGASLKGCRDAAEDRGLAYFGMQNGDECWGGASYGRHGKTSNSQCNVPCKVRPRQNCGAVVRNAIFATNVGMSLLPHSWLQAQHAFMPALCVNAL